MWPHETIGECGKNDISELGFNQTLITRVTLYDGMSFVFVLKLSGKLLQMKDCD